MIIQKDNEQIIERLDKQDNYYEASKLINSKLIFSFNEGLSNLFISICIPTFNRISGVKRSILSAINQIGFSENYAVIIVDNDPDFSNRELAEFLEGLSIPTNCAVFYYKNQENMGMFGNFNKCIALANTDFIGMLHDDDIIFENYLYRIKNILNKYSCKKVGYIRCAGDQIYGNVNINNHKIRNRLKALFSQKLNKVSKVDCYLSGSAGALGSPSCGTVINRQAFIQVKGYNPSCYPSSDCYPPFLMMSKYNVYTTISPFGAKYFGENESVRLETMRGWLKEYLFFQQYMAAKSALAKRIISKYGDEQYSAFINNYLTKLMALGGQEYHIGMFDDIYIAHPSKIKSKILSLLVAFRIYAGYMRTFFIG